MATLGDLKADIADSIDDDTGEYAEQIAKAIDKAIRYCSSTVYFFNQTRDVTFPTVQGQEWYGGDDNANIPTLVHIERAYSEDVSGRRSQLSRYRPEDLEILSDSGASVGEPYAYAYFNRKIRLYPIPGATIYTIRLQLAPYRLSGLSNDEDENAWTAEGYDLIYARAKYILGKDTLKDAILAAEALNDFNDHDVRLKAETSAREGTGRIVPTCF